LYRWPLMESLECIGCPAGAESDCIGCDFDHGLELDGSDESYANLQPLTIGGGAFTGCVSAR
jgi:hypothetical protein